MHTILENLFLVKNCLVKDLRFRRRSRFDINIMNNPLKAKQTIDSLENDNYISLKASLKTQKVQEQNIKQII